jgi:hypothetical protein
MLFIVSKLGMLVRPLLCSIWGDLAMPCYTIFAWSTYRRVGKKESGSLWEDKNLPGWVDSGTKLSAFILDNIALLIGECSELLELADWFLWRNSNVEEKYTHVFVKDIYLWFLVRFLSCIQAMVLWKHVMAEKSRQSIFYFAETRNDVMIFTIFIFYYE